jgi:hypothetical protein
MITTIEAADAKAGLVLVGCGNGHGVGLSQYGANELASQGWDYRAILLYFYRGAALARLPADFTGNGREAEYCYEDAPGTEAVSVDFYTPYVPQAGRPKNR